MISVQKCRDDLRMWRHKPQSFGYDYAKFVNRGLKKSLLNLFNCWSTDFSFILAIGSEISAL